MFDWIFNQIEKNLVIIYAILILIFATITFGSNYQYPNSSIWDESYHISSAEKIIEGTMYMETHPAFGKMAIALGEVIINPNAQYDQLNLLGKFCLSVTPTDGKYKDFENKDQEYKVEYKNDKGQLEKRVPTLLELRKYLFEQKLITGPINKSDFTKTNSIGSDNKNPYPAYMSWCGFRFMPVISGILGGLMFFLALFFILDNKHLALLFSSLYIFDNGFIIQSRAALLDPIQHFLFLVTLATLGFGIWQSRKKNQTGNQSNQQISVNITNYVILGFVTGLSTATKVNGAVSLLFAVIWAGWEIFSRTKQQSNWKLLIQSFIKPVAKVILTIIICLITYLGISYYHVGRGNIIVNDNYSSNGKYYIGRDLGVKPEKINENKKFVTSNYYFWNEWSDKFNNQLSILSYDTRKWSQNTYLEELQGNRSWGFKAFVSGTIANYFYMEEDHKGIPKFDVKKPDENGSYPMNWAVLNKTISYRWETSDNISYRYLYFIGNPLSWLVGLIGIMLSLCLIVAYLIFDLPIRNRYLFNWIQALTGVYVIYMSIMMYIISKRVIYIYMYLPALILSWVLSALVFKYLLETDFDKKEFNISFKNNAFLVYLGLILLAFTLIVAFIFYAPFSYYQPLTNEEFQLRNLFDFWQMKTANGK